MIQIPCVVKSIGAEYRRQLSVESDILHQFTASKCSFTDFIQYLAFDIDLIHAETSVEGMCAYAADICATHHIRQFQVILEGIVINLSDIIRYASVFHRRRNIQRVAEPLLLSHFRCFGAGDLI